MDLEFSIVSDILFITKHKIDHNFGPNLNIEKILSVLDSPYHSREAKKKSKNHFRIKWVKPKQERHQDVVRVSNTCGRENRETSETVTLMAAQSKKKRKN